MSDEAFIKTRINFVVGGVNGITHSGLNVQQLRDAISRNERPDGLLFLPVIDGDVKPDEAGVLVLKLTEVKMIHVQPYSTVTLDQQEQEAMARLRAIREAKSTQVGGTDKPRNVILTKGGQA